MKRGMIIGLVAGALVLVLVWYFALYAPTAKDIDDAKAKTAAAQDERAGLEATLHRLQDLAKTAPQQQAALRTLDAAVPETPDLADFIIQANDIARRAGIDFLSIAPTPPAPGATASTTTINLTITIQGGFFQVLDYLKDLEHLDRLVIVDTLNLGSAAGGGDSGTGASAAASSASATGSGSLSVSITGRMFTRAPAASGAGGTNGSGGATTTPTTPSASGSAPTTPSTTAAPGSGNS